MTTQVSTNTQSLSINKTKTSGNIAAIVFGLVVLFAVGFLPMNAAHNAAHDTRHAHAFPCH